MNWSRRRLQSAARSFMVIAPVLIATAVIAEFVLSRSQQRMALEFILVLSIVIAIQVYVGNSGLLSFGHVAFFAIAAYSAALVAMPPEQKASQTPLLPDFLLNLQLPLIGAVLVAMLVVFIFSSFVGVPLARMHSSVIPMATLALLVVVHSLINVSTEWTRGPSGLVAVPDLVDTWTILATGLFVCAAALLYSASPWGLKLQATREDAVAATSLGIPVARMRFFGWVYSSVLTAIAGSVWALNSLALSPEKFFFAETFALLTILVIGGLGSISGALIGAVIVTALTELLRGLEGGISLGSIELPQMPGIVQMATAVLILLVLIWKPQGILGKREFGEILTRRKA